MSVRLPALVHLHALVGWYACWLPTRPPVVSRFRCCLGFVLFSAFVSEPVLTKPFHHYSEVYHLSKEHPSVEYANRVCPLRLYALPHSHLHTPFIITAIDIMFVSLLGMQPV